MGSEEVPLTLSRSEALVLFEWLATAESDKAIPIPDHAEQQVLWNIEAQLEKSLWEVLSSEYGELLVSAKNDVLNTDQ
jgi:hypothetical protein